MTSLYKSHIAFILIYALAPTENSAMAYHCHGAPVEKHWYREDTLDTHTLDTLEKTHYNTGIEKTHYNTGIEKTHWI